MTEEHRNREVASASAMPGPASPSSPQPVLLLGGFLISAEAYRPMQLQIGQLCGQPVVLIEVSRREWLTTVFAEAWARILDRVLEQTRALAAKSPTGGVTLVGHSSGGVMLRLFLDDQPFRGRRYNGREFANTLVTLGSPHTARKATKLRSMVAERLPGAWFHPPVRYVSVAGDLDLRQSARQASPLARRLAPSAYRAGTGDAHDRGDGLVPVASASLEGSEAVVLPGVAHGGAFGPLWYGTPSVVCAWWSRVADGPGFRAG